MRKRIAVFCDFSNKFVEQIRTILQSKNIEIVNVRHGTQPYSDYVQALGARLLHILDAYPVENWNLSVMLVVGTRDDGQFETIRKMFFPSVRCFRKDRSSELSQPAGREFAHDIIDRFVDWERSNFEAQVRPYKHNPTLLPLQNIKSKRLTNSLLNMWSFESNILDQRVFKEIGRPKGDKGFSARGLNFSGVLNGTKHPVRRCTDSIECDLKAKLRLGHQVPARFEYDVTSPHALCECTFYLCNGRPQKVPRKATHLNMRINDDFKHGND